MSLTEKMGSVLDSLLFRALMAILFFITFFFWTLPNIIGLPKNIFVSNLLVVLSAIFLILFLVSVLFLRKNRIPIYVHRKKFLENNLKNFINESSSNIKILNVSFTWFEHLKDILTYKIVEDSLQFEVLLVKRKRNKNDISYLTLREKDEGREQELKILSNKTLFSIFCFLVNLASTRGISHIKKFQVKEYDFMPAITMYIFDDKKLVFGPYIAKNCEDIPLIQIERNIKTTIKNPIHNIASAFNELMEHYNILSGDYEDIKKKNKEYIQNESCDAEYWNNPFRWSHKECIQTFSFFDGKENRSIHKFIENNLNEIIPVLKQKSQDYYDYLVKERNIKFDDDIIKELGEDQFEGRFDAVMRDIYKTISKPKN